MSFWKRLFSKKRYIVLDVGTTGIKAFVFDEEFRIKQSSYKLLSKNVAPGGKVEQDPKEIIDTSIELVRDVAKKERLTAYDTLSFGIATQRETTVLWDKETGQNIGPAISWEDTRTGEMVQNTLSEDKQFIKDNTGLSLEPYFSATKMRWILDNIKPDWEKTLFGTLDSWILWNLVSPKKHLTDITNASRTLLFNIKEAAWDDALLSIFGIEKKMLADVLPSASDYGILDHEVLGFPVPIRAVCGDQQASLFAAGSSVGTTKITYGTGIFIMQIISSFKTYSDFYTTLAAGNDMVPHYAVEAKIGGSAKRIDTLRSLGKDISQEVEALISEASVLVSRLPVIPEKIIIDGGISNHENSAIWQKKFTGVEIFKQATIHGTALGVAKLLSLYGDEPQTLKTSSFVIKK